MSGDLLDKLDGLPPAERGPAFERLVKWWLTADPVYASQVKRVWLWAEWPGRWGADAGIDLVAETHTGELWAVQSKAYADGASVTKASVDSFLSESNRPTFAYRLLVATTDRIAPNALRAMHGQEKPVGIVRRTEIRASTVRWPRSLTALDAAPKRKRRKPRPHQRRAIRDVTRGLAERDRGQLIMACGTGKTLTALWIAEGLQATRTLVLVPSLSLLKQTLDEWLAEASEPFPFLAVCSDETVAPEHDEPVPYTTDLGVPVTTDADQVRTFLRRRGRRVIFATYQSSPVIAEAQAAPRVPHLDLVLADEAHRCAGTVSSAFGTVLDANRLHARSRVFMTATPRYFTGRVRREARDADLELASMDDEQVFGPVLHRLPFGEAIRRELLTDYRVLVTAVDHPTYAWMVAQAELVRDAKLGDTDARTLAREITLLRAMRRYDLRRVLSFHGRVRGARRFAEELGDVADWAPDDYRPDGRLWASWVSGEMNVADRSARLDYFRHLDDDEHAVLASARCLSEGVDVPTIDGVAFIDPRRSQVDIVQAVGRAIRLAEDKTLGTIIVPVLVEPGDDAETVLDGSEFKRVWEVVRALRAHDEDLAEELDGARRRLGREKTTGDRSAKLLLDVPAELGADFAAAFDVELVNATTASWEWWLGLLQRHVSETGTSRVRRDLVVDGHRLGSWASEQRKHRAALTSERRAALDALPDWIWNYHENSWEISFGALTRYVQREGHARVPWPHVEDDVKLGRFVTQCRVNRETLPANRLAALEGLPGWSWSAVESKWERGLASISDYVEREGNAQVPATWSEGGFALGTWVTRQRRRRAHLTAEQVSRLEALPGWDWSPWHSSWNRGLDALRAFAEREGHTAVPEGFSDSDEFPLYDWVTNHRGRRKLMSETRRRQLEAVPYWSWSGAEAREELALRRVMEYVGREGHARVPAGHVESGFGLGNWVQRQRQRRQTLSPERRARLDALPGWVWNTRLDAWERGFAELAAYVDEKGEASVPSRYVTPDGYRLGSWAHEQRRARARLGQWQQEALAALPGWAWDSAGTAWEDWFAELVRYTERTGNASPPTKAIQDGRLIGRWVARQRTQRDSLTPEQVSRLEALPGWTWGGIIESTWEERFAAVAEYAREHGHARPPQNVPVVGEWVSTQRRAYRRGRMDPERAVRLERLPGWRWGSRAH